MSDKTASLQVSILEDLQRLPHYINLTHRIEGVQLFARRVAALADKVQFFTKERTKEIAFQELEPTEEPRAGEEEVLNI